jgi:two-component system, NarL family, response regulator LiaR
MSSAIQDKPPEMVGRVEQRIRVLIVDDHAVVRSGLATFLSVYDDLEPIGEAVNGEQAVAMCGMLLPDVVLMDLMMPVMDGAAATAEIRRCYPSVQVIALTSFGEQDFVQSALEAGAIGYLLKNISPADLADAIRDAHRGLPTLAPEAVEALIRAATHPHHHVTDLTDRERAVLSLMTSGLTNLEIACRMGVSRSTVKFHASNILSKLGVGSRTEAVAFGLQEHLVK